MVDSFEVEGHTYSLAGRLDARRQFHVVRRLGPIAGALADVVKNFGQFRDFKSAIETASVRAIEPVLVEIARMPEDDVDYVLGACLSVVRRQVPGGQGWAPVLAQDGRSMMFVDLNMAAMLQLVWRVLEENLAGFFGTSPSSSPAATGPNGPTSRTGRAGSSGPSTADGVSSRA
jgi:hypothetical protein